VAHVRFDDVLDLTPFCFTKADKAAAETLKYQLTAVVMHHGRGFGSGHYTAYCFNPCAGNVFFVQKYFCYNALPKYAPLCLSISVISQVALLLQRGCAMLCVRQ